MSEKKKEPIAEQKLSRRSMLKWTGALAAAAIVGAVAEYGASELMKPVPPPPPPPVSFKPPLSPEIKQRVDAIKKQLIAVHAGETYQYTTCQTNGCRGGPCPVKVHIKNGVINGISMGDPKHKGVTIEDQYLGEEVVKTNMIQARPCVRGYLWPKTVYNPNRLLYPMKRVGARGERKFVRISWQEALDTVANTVKQLRDKYGPYFSSSGPASSYLNYGYGTWGVGSNSCWVMPEMMMFGYSIFGKNREGKSYDNQDVWYTKAMVGFGYNPLVSLIAAGQSAGQTFDLMYLHEKGLPIIIVDPIYSLSCEVLADQWIPIRAGTDMALFLAIANVLYKEGIYQKDYVAKYVEPKGFQKWMDYVTGKTAGPDGAIDRTPEWAEPITAIPAQTIRELARFCAKYAPNITWAMYMKVGKQVYGEQVGWADHAVKAMLGTKGVLGTGWDSISTSTVAYISSPSVDWKRARGTWSSHQLVASNNGSGMQYELYQKLLKGEITEDRYRREIGCAADWPLPRPVMKYGGSGLVSSCESTQVARGVKNLEFVCANSYHITHPDAFLADVLLPQADETLEDTVGFMAQANQFILGRKSIEPQGEAKSSTWINMQLSKRFGLLDKTEPLLKDLIDDQKKMDEKIESLHKEAYETWAAQEEIKPLKPPTWDEFSKAPIFAVPQIGESFRAPSKPPYRKLAAFIADPKKNPVDTPSGLMEIYSDWLVNPDMPTKGYITPRRKLDQEMCFGGASPTPTPPMPQWIGNIQYDGPLTKYAEKYPLQVGSLHSAYRAHNSNDANPDFRVEARHACWLSIADAKARGIKDGDLVRVSNPYGEMVLPAYVTPRVTPGTANVGYGGWLEPSSVKTDLMPDGIDRRGSQNVLTPAHTYPWIAGSAHYKTNCQVEKFEVS